MSTNKEVLRDGYSQPGFTINWGAIFAGLALILSVGWLWVTLSAAIGLSVIDIDQLQGSDMSSGEVKSIGMAAMLWMIVTAVITYFLGGFLSGKVSGRPNQATGTLHGVVLWSCTIIIGMILGAIGVSGIVSTATGAAKSVASSGFNTAAIIASQRGNDGKSESSDISFLHPLVGSLKQGLTKTIAQAEQASDEAGGKHDQNSGTEKENERTSTPSSSDDEKNQKKGTSDKSVAERAEKMIDRTDPKIFAAAAIALIQGDKKQAKEILASHMDIDEEELDKVIQKVQKKAEVVADEMKVKAEKVKEYATSVLWVIIFSYLAGLLACIGGAHLGVERKGRAI